MVTEEHVLELIPAYALGSLDEEEEIRVSEHLILCNSCVEELHTYELLVAELSLGVNLTDPPQKLKEQLFTQVKASEHPPQTVVQTSLWKRLKSQFRLVPGWGWAALGVILLLSLSNFFLWGRLTVLENHPGTDFITVQMQGTDIIPLATGVLVISQNGEYGTLIVDGLPTIDESMAYQLWLIEDGQRTSGGLFSVNEEGYGMLELTTPTSLLIYSEFGITVEPEGGSEGPTGEKVLGGVF